MQSFLEVKGDGKGDSNGEVAGMVDSAIGATGGRLMSLE
jgi:hypothetical protein